MVYLQRLILVSCLLTEIRDLVQSLHKFCHLEPKITYKTHVGSFYFYHSTWQMIGRITFDVALIIELCDSCPCHFWSNVSIDIKISVIWSKNMTHNRQTWLSLPMQEQNRMGMDHFYVVLITELCISFHGSFLTITTMFIGILPLDV